MGVNPGVMGGPNRHHLHGATLLSRKTEKAAASSPRHQLCSELLWKIIPSEDELTDQSHQTHQEVQSPARVLQHVKEMREGPAPQNKIRGRRIQRQHQGESLEIKNGHWKKTLLGETNSTMDRAEKNC